MCTRIDISISEAVPAGWMIPVVVTDNVDHDLFQIDAADFVRARSSGGQAVLDLLAEQVDDYGAAILADGLKDEADFFLNDMPVDSTHVFEAFGRFQPASSAGLSM